MKKLSGGILAALLVTVVSTSASAQLRSGEEVYNSLCVACHETGVAHAPKTGNSKEWAPLIEEGQAVLTADAFIGVRAMPAQGGDENLSLEEFARAVAWLARSAGGDWKDPDATMMHNIRHAAWEQLEERIQAKKDLRDSLAD